VIDNTVHLVRGLGLGNDDVTNPAVMAVAPADL
jgi:hypothetical protein